MTDKKPRRRRRINGDGSVYQRKDGIWTGAFYTYTSSGARKRVVVYSKSLAVAREKLAKAQQQARAGIPVPDEAWTVGRYLEYWLENVVRSNRRPATYALYESIVRIYLLPGLGSKSLTRLSVPAVQVFLNQRLEKGDSIRKVQVMKTVLSSALSRAVREELISRNVARSTELPEWHRVPVRPWTAAEARQFLAASQTDPLYPAFALLALCGLRRGEALGLQWADVDLDKSVINVRQQLQRVRGELRLGPVKTHAGNRSLPLPGLAVSALKLRAEQQAADHAALGDAWFSSDHVFTSRTGRPIEPRNLVRSFRRICEQHKIRIIKIHHLRHTVASLLKDLQVPARDAQAILGHTRISTTLEIYTGSADEAQRDALDRLDSLLDNREN